MTYLEWDDSTRSSYVVDHPCVLFDVYWVPFGTNVHKYWLGMSCDTEHDFVCMKIMDGNLTVLCLACNKKGKVAIGERRYTHLHKFSSVNHVLRKF